jgi:hypothetical protein
MQRSDFLLVVSDEDIYPSREFQVPIQPRARVSSVLPALVQQRITSVQVFLPLLHELRIKLQWIHPCFLQGV